jgi:hypothetical protein
MDDVLDRLLDKTWDKFLQTPENTRFCKSSNHMLLQLFQLTKLVSNRHWRHSWLRYPRPSSSHVVCHLHDAGKTTLSKRLTNALNARHASTFPDGAPVAAFVPMDGYRRSNPDCYCPFLFAMGVNALASPSIQPRSRRHD